MGYVLQQCLANAFLERGQPAVVTSLVTQVLVDEDDPAFDRPTKPIGEMIPAHKVGELEAQGWKLVEDRHRHGWRRVVASPDPKEILEAAAVRALVDEGTIVIAAGGGGIPVVQNANGSLHGVPAVVDKDLASALLASDLRADALLILTDIDSVRTGFDTPDEQKVGELTVARARELLAAGEFGEGSMAPKVEALCRYVAATGSTGVISAIEDCAAAIEGGAGTRIVR
jgi:carbamate kinase